MKKLTKLLALGLLVVGLSSCGVDSTKFEETDTGEEVTTETNKTDINDLDERLTVVEACLAGDIEACNRAEETGFSRSPFFSEDIENAAIINFDGMNFSVMSNPSNPPIGTLGAFKRRKDFNNVCDNSRVMQLKWTMFILDDYTIEMRVEYKWDVSSTWTVEGSEPTAGCMDTVFEGMYNETGIVWESTSKRYKFLIDGVDAEITQTK